MDNNHQPVKPRWLLTADDCGTPDGHRYHRLIADESPCETCATFRCGTEAEYAAHRRYGEPVCDKCRQARSEANKTRRLKRQAQTIAPPASVTEKQTGPVVFTDALGSDGRVDPNRIRIAGPATGYRRHYRLPGGGDPVPSVTTLLRAMWRPQLESWKARQIADWWLKAPDLLQGMSSREAHARVKQIPYDSIRLARRRGSETHQALDMVLSTTSTPEERQNMAENVIGGTLDDHSQECLRGAVDVLNRLKAEVVASEAVVWHPQGDQVPAYAGTVDMILKLPADGELAEQIGWTESRPIVAVADLKTGPGVYSSDHLQVAAYSRATQMLLADGTVTDMPSVDCGLIVNTHPDDKRLIVVDTDKAWEQFVPVSQHWRHRIQGREASTVAVIDYPISEKEATGDERDEGSEKVEQLREVLRNDLNSLYRDGVDWETLRSLLPAPVDKLTATQIVRATAALRKTQPPRRVAEPPTADDNSVDVQRETLRSRLNDLHRRGVDRQTLQELLPNSIDQLTAGQIASVMARLETIEASAA